MFKHIFRSSSSKSPAHKEVCKYVELEDQVPEKMDYDIGVERWTREIPPAHFIFKISSFSLFSKTKVEKHESGIFEAFGKSWKLCIYPKGNKKAGGYDHISLYLQIAETDKLPQGWEVHAKFSLFVFDHLQDRFLTIQEAGGKVRRFHNLKTQWGFDKLLSLSTFNNPSNGYLVDDSCIFGAEIFVVSSGARRECLSMVKNPKYRTYTWKICNFSSKKNDDLISSEHFIVEGVEWNLCLYPQGNSTVKGQSLSLYLKLADPANDIRQIIVQFTLRICNQWNSRDRELQLKRIFGVPSSVVWGSSNFMGLRRLESNGSGFLVNDTLLVEVEFSFMSIFSDF